MQPSLDEMFRTDSLGGMGPIIASIGNLLIVVLIPASDVVFGVGMKVVRSWNFMDLSQMSQRLECW